MSFTKEQLAAIIANYNNPASTEIDLSTISITGVEGVGGGGDLTASRTLFLNIDSLSTIGSVDSVNDLILIYDADTNTHKVTTPAAIASAGADANYVHTQGSPSSTWNVNHGLGKFCSVVVVDTAKNVIQPDVEYIDSNNITLTFSGNTAGEAYCN
jgi:hypothetical protein